MKLWRNALSNALGREVVFEKIFEPIKPGDVPATYASTDLLQKAVGFKPETSIEEGLQKFADWYVEYYEVRSRGYFTMELGEHGKVDVYSLFCCEIVYYFIGVYRQAPNTLDMLQIRPSMNRF